MSLGSPGQGSGKLLGPVWRLSNQALFYGRRGVTAGGTGICTEVKFCQCTWLLFEKLSGVVYHSHGRGLLLLRGGSVVELCTRRVGGGQVVSRKYCASYGGKGVGWPRQPWQCSSRNLAVAPISVDSGQDAYKFGRLAGCASFWAFAGQGLFNSWHSFPSELLDAISSKVCRRGPTRPATDLQSANCRAGNQQMQAAVKPSITFPPHQVAISMPGALGAESS